MTSALSETILDSMPLGLVAIDNKMTEVDQIDKIVQQFLQLSKKEIHLSDQKRFDLQETIHDLSGLCDSEAILNGIELSLHHDVGALPVMLNRTEWKQIVVNLIRNSFDAFSEGNAGKGTIVVLQVPLQAVEMEKESR